jgi:protein gp37
MGETTLIAWTDHTFNLAHGCMKVSPGCKNCYAETFTTRVSDRKIWGPAATTERRIFGPHHWQEPRRWNAKAHAEGRLHRVFCASMCDWAEDHPTIINELPKLWPLIRDTPWLEWQLLTKRAERIAESLPPDWGAGYPNVWLGVSAENQEWADKRLPHLLEIPARVHFASYEPALGPVDFSAYLGPRKLNWLIYGGESGPGYRHADPQWARNALKQCRKAGVAYFHKQSSAPRTEMGIELDGKIIREYPPERPLPVATAPLSRQVQTPGLF